MYRIKNWRKFQHFKDRKPPWIKLYRDLLDDIDWHKLDGEAAKTLVMLWLLASEMDGQLPDTKEIAFRLRTTEIKVKQSLAKLIHWLERDDIKTISKRYQDDIKTISKRYQNDLSETETETETETEPPARPVGEDGFEQFWKAYPRKQGKKAAYKAWQKAKDKPEISHILRQLVIQKQSDQWTKDGGQYIPLPATWLNQGRWADEVEIKTAIASMPVPKPVPLYERWNRAKNICLRKLQEAANSGGDIGRTLSICRDLYRDLPKYNGEDAVTEAYEIFKYQRSKQQEATK